jgi:hypothetical protein
MIKLLLSGALILSGVLKIGVVTASLDQPAALAKAFAGVYRFDYLFSENGIVYVDVPGHLQLLELDKHEDAPRVVFFNQTSRGEKRPHYSYVFYEKDNKLTLREFDGRGNFRFDCVGMFQPEKRTFECAAPRAPKPARDTDSPVTRKSGLFKRLISWPAYETLDRNNLFRFYDWDSSTFSRTSSSTPAEKSSPAKPA